MVNKNKVEYYQGSKKTEIYDISTEQYLEEISKFKVLTEEEERYLFLELKNGNLEARKKLIESNLKLVVYTVKKYFNKNKGISMSILDLIQEGNIALFKAIDAFDLNKDIKFSTYATILIRRDVLKSINDFGYMIRIPSNMREELLKIKKYRRDFFVESGCFPSRKDLIKYFGYSEARLEELLINEQDIESLDYPLKETYNSNLVERIVDIDSDKTISIENKMYYEELMLEVQELLTPKEYEVFIDRIIALNGEKTLSELAIKLGVSQERVRKIGLNAIEKIKRKNKYRI